MGDMVRSIAGRDQGRYFLILDVMDQNYVLIVDGDLRRIEKPKKKKVKHLIKTGIASQLLKEHVEGKSLNNAFLRRELERLGLRS